MTRPENVPADLDTLAEALAFHPCEFIEATYVVDNQNMGGPVPFKFTPWQRDQFERVWFWDTEEKGPYRGIKRKSREIGATAVNCAVFNASQVVFGGDIFALADNRDHAVTNIKYHRGFLRGLRAAGLPVTIKKDNEKEIVYEIGDRTLNINALPCTTTSGLSARAKYLHLTEVQDWPNADTVWGAVSGTFPSQGMAIAEGTGAGGVDTLWSRWKESVLDYQRRGEPHPFWNDYEEVWWDAWPDHTEEWAKGRRATMLDWEWRKHYELEDVAPGTPFFDPKHNIAGAYATGSADFAEIDLADPKAVAKWYKAIGAPPVLFSGIDTAEGLADGDHSAYCLLDGTALEIASGADRWPPEVLVDVVATELDRLERVGYEIAPVGIEANAIGHSTIQATRSHPGWRWPIQYQRRGRGRSRTRMAGIWNVAHAKRRWFDLAERDFREGEIGLTSRTTRDQLARIQASTLEAPPGEKDDAAIAFLIANFCRHLRRGTT
ncbi:MAG: hypothetical protein VW405_07530 [Rhodospirillaceae bacterium]